MPSLVPSASGSRWSSTGSRGQSRSWDSFSGGTRPPARGTASARDELDDADLAGGVTIRRVAEHSERGEGGLAAVFGGVAEFGFDAQQLVVLGDPVAARRGAGLDLPAVGGHGEVGDRGVFGLPGAV